MRQSPIAVCLAVCLAVAALVIACGPDAVVDRPITANQEPVAALAVPAEGQARVLVTAALDGTRDVDGAVARVELTWGDDTPPHVVEIADLADPNALPAFEHAYERAGLYDVELAVTDDRGVVGRARTRIAVAPPPDAAPPAVASVTVSRDGVALAEGAHVAFGAVDVTVHATDLEGHLEGADIAVASAPAVSVTLAGAAASGTVSVTLDAESAGEGDVVIGVVARDSFGNVSAPVTFALTVLGPTSDSDGDGLVDLDDPAPDVFNGLDAELFAIDDIGEDFVGNQRAEDIVASLDAAEDGAQGDGAVPLASFTVAAVALDVATSSAPVSALADHEGDVSAQFAIRYRGSLVAPAGATHVVVEVAADDIGIVFLDGIAVASADGEYASDFFRFQRAPAESAPIGLPAGRVPLEIVLANGAGPYAWSVRFRFLAGETTIMNPEAVSQRQFSVQE